MYKMDIGVEIHVELSTDEKLFCGCKNKFTKEPNTLICPICMGLPGALPVVNKEAVFKAVRAGFALNGEVQKSSAFDRKNYFYVDNPKNYQITQFYKPIVKGGNLKFFSKGQEKEVGITQIHIEEDAGKLIHRGDDTLIDLNRAGVPLIEIVTEPHMKSKEECGDFLRSLRKVLLWNGISDCRMEEGSIRFDLNISLRKDGEDKLGQRIEVKNINSFKNVERCIDYEYIRQSEILNKGEEIAFETRRWDDQKGVTVSLRKKEEAKDYRYIPDGDLSEIYLNQSLLDDAKKDIQGSSYDKISILMERFGVSLYDSGIIGGDRSLFHLFMETSKRSEDYKGICNFILGEVCGVLKEEKKQLGDSSFRGEQLGKIVNLKNEGVINNNAGKIIIREIIINGGEVNSVIEDKGLLQKNDTGEIREVISELLKENEEKVLEYKNGKEKLYGWFFGGVMKVMKGKGNPSIVKKILNEELLK